MLRPDELFDIEKKAIEVLKFVENPVWVRAYENLRDAATNLIGMNLRSRYGYDGNGPLNENK